MTNFNKAHQFTAKWEGGLVDHKNDPGGITNHGISLRFLQGLEGKTNIDIDFNDDGYIDGQDIRACTKDQSAALMRENFWKPLCCNELSFPLALVLYDASVNCGPSRGTKFLQEACNTMIAAHGLDLIPLVVDGGIGPKTLMACLDIKNKGLSLYTAKCAISKRVAYYERLVANNNNFAPFLRGWLNRCEDLEDYLNRN